jgi:quercetin dioxygenase-like cupin family protein
LVNPVNVHVVAGDVIVQVNPPGEEVTVKEVAGPEVAPRVAAVTATVICVFPADPEIATVGIPAVTGIHCA